MIHAFRCGLDGQGALRRPGHFEKAIKIDATKSLSVAGS
jgi:hypothetical protein